MSSIARPDIPFPPPELRVLVGRLEDDAYDNPSGESAFPRLPPDADEEVFDFGCGCGRIARKLALQRRPPRRYLGVDLHRGMIDWCNHNIAPRIAGFSFVHHDVYSAGLNPGGCRKPLSFPTADGGFSLVVANSVFTHILQDAVEHYLHECARVLRPDGVLYATWFLFQRADFPMLQHFQNALYVNLADPSNAVIFEREWVRETARTAGFAITDIEPPFIHGFHWTITMQRTRNAVEEAGWPVDDAPLDQMPPPLMPQGASECGRTLLE